MSLNLFEQLHWQWRGHTKVKSEQLCKGSSPLPFPGGFVGEADQRKATTHDWPARLRGRDTAGDARETHVRLPIGPLRAGKGQVKQNRTSVFGVSGVPQHLRTIGHFLREAELWGFGLVRSE